MNIQANSEMKNDPQSSSIKLSYDWIIGKWQTTTREFGLTTLIVNNDNTVIYYGSNTPQFRGKFTIEDDVMYCFFETENIKFPLNNSNQTIDFGQGYYAKKISD